MRSGIEESENNKNVTDSGYSNSCSNSQSRSGSSKCSGRNSAGSSGSGDSSTFRVLASPKDAGKDGRERKEKKKEQEKKNKRKKNRSGGGGESGAVGEGPQPPPAEVQPLAETSPPRKNVFQLEAEVETRIEGNVVNTAALSQTLLAMRKMKYHDSEDTESYGKDLKQLQIGGEKPLAEITLEQIASLMTDDFHESEMRIAVSIFDGVVIYTSSLTPALGYPKDMWIGRSLIDFVHSKHRASFASYIIQSISELPDGNGKSSGQRSVYYCCLRKYRALKNGFTSSEQLVNYLPCQITLQFKELPSVAENMFKECLVISATPIRSAYKYPDETRMSPKFTTRHSVKCQFVHVDLEVTPYFGFLPQDMLSRSVLDFYHPDDLHFLKEVYEAVIKEQGHPFRSKPYRFLCQNGGYALVETELSSFINPWTRKLEFIIGQHSVIRGPPNPDVTTPCADPKTLNISEEVWKETKIVQEEIKCLLNETIVRCSETAKQQVSKRCKDLAAFMENLLDEITKPPDLKVVVPTEEQSFSERDSVMLGEISPHHDYYDSKSVSETPPSYNQLNYNENIHRFFESKPKTTVSDESSGSGGYNKAGGSSGEEGKTSPNDDSSSGSKSGDSGASSGQSTESNGNSGKTTCINTSNNAFVNHAGSTKSFKNPALTEQLLSRHNEDMEKQMVQKHRVSRTKSDRDSKIKERLRPREEFTEEAAVGSHLTEQLLLSQGLKRCGSHSWEGEPFKTLKASNVEPAIPLDCPEEQPDTSTRPEASSLLQTSTTAPSCSPPTTTAGRPPWLVSPRVPPPLAPSSVVSANLWAAQRPPACTTSPVVTVDQEFTTSAVKRALMPIYFQTPDRSNIELAAHVPVPAQQPSIQLMPSMLFHPFMYGTPPLQAYAPMMYPSAAYSLINGESARTLTVQQRLPTIKADLEANLQALTPHQYVREGQHLSNQKTSDNEGGSNEISTPYDDSSYQSSFFSFQKTDKSDESIKSYSETEKTEYRRCGVHIAGKDRPARKVAPWIENVHVTSDLTYKYQLKERRLEETLAEDAAALDKIKQPSLVNDQLSQMYQDLELEGLSRTLALDEGMTASSESSGDDARATKNSSEVASGLKRRKRYMEYDKMTILFEEDAPMPPPIVARCT